MGAMLKLDVSNNALCAAGAKVLAEILTGNQVLTEIIMASNFLGKKTPHLSGDTDMSGVAALADAIPGMGAMSTVIVNTFPLPIRDIKSKAELDFSGKGLKVEDGIIIAALILSNVSSIAALIFDKYFLVPVITDTPVCTVTRGGYCLLICLTMSWAVKRWGKLLEICLQPTAPFSSSIYPITSSNLGVQSLRTRIE
jgi:hypothetical protein